MEINDLFLPSAGRKGHAAEIGIAILTYGVTEKELNSTIALIEPEYQASDRVALNPRMRCKNGIVHPGGAIRKVFSRAEEIHPQ